MHPVPSCYRETDPSHPTSLADGPRYSPSEFYTLSNRRISSPGFTPDSTLEPLPAEYSKLGRTVVTADKRARTRSPGPSSERIVHGSCHRTSKRKTSWSSVKEEDGGKLPHNFREPRLLRILLPKHIILNIIMRSGIAQSFLESVNGSVATPTDAVHDAASPTESGSCDCCCHGGRSPKWQPPGPGRKRRSKSYTELRTGISELSGWDLDVLQCPEPAEIQEKSFGPGESPIERLPAEVLGE